MLSPECKKNFSTSPNQQVESTTYKSNRLSLLEVKILQFVLKGNHYIV